MAKHFINKDIKSLIKSMEGYSATAYVDAQGYSIGYGHFIKKGEEHLRHRIIDEYEAEALLEGDIKEHQAPWIGDLKEGTAPAKIAALTSFAYNVGANSPALKKAVGLINSGNNEAAAAVLGKYTKSRQGPSGELVPLKALEERRAFEGKLLTSDEDDIDIEDAWSDRKSLWGKVKSIFVSKEDFPSAISESSDSLLVGENERVLSELRSLNAELGPIGSDYDSQYEQRLIREGQDRWAAN